MFYNWLWILDGQPLLLGRNSSRISPQRLATLDCLGYFHFLVGRHQSSIVQVAQIYIMEKRWWTQSTYVSETVHKIQAHASVTKIYLHPLHPTKTRFCTRTVTQKRNDELARPARRTQYRIQLQWTSLTSMMQGHVIKVESMHSWPQSPVPKHGGWQHPGCLVARLGEEFWRSLLWLVGQGIKVLNKVGNYKVRINVNGSTDRLIQKNFAQSIGQAILRYWKALAHKDFQKSPPVMQPSCRHHTKDCAGSSTSDIQRFLWIGNLLRGAVTQKENDGSGRCLDYEWSLHQGSVVLFYNYLEDGWRRKIISNWAWWLGSSWFRSSSNGGCQRSRATQ